MYSLFLPLLFSVLPLGRAQSLLEATISYPELSRFNELIFKHPQLAPNVTSTPQTILVPSNDAFNSYYLVTGQQISDLGAAVLTPLFQYQTLNASFNSSDLSLAQSLLLASELTQELYNHRGNSSNGTQGQVVYASTNNKTISSRQLASGPFIKSGAGNQVILKLTDGVWAGGIFHIVEGYSLLHLFIATSPLINDRAGSSPFPSLVREPFSSEASAPSTKLSRAPVSPIHSTISQASHALPRPTRPSPMQEVPT